MRWFLRDSSVKEAVKERDSLKEEESSAARRRDVDAIAKSVVKAHCCDVLQ
jgi:hypothetical protein